MFDQPYISLGVVNLPAHNLVPGTPYRLLWSTNLVTWIILSTNTAPANPYTFTDPSGPANIDRFYRLATP